MHWYMSHPDSSFLRLLSNLKRVESGDYSEIKDHPSSRWMGCMECQIFQKYRALQITRLDNVFSGLENLSIWFQSAKWYRTVMTRNPRIEDMEVYLRGSQACLKSSVFLKSLVTISVLYGWNYCQKNTSIQYCRWILPT